jgi:hypothetical protein
MQVAARRVNGVDYITDQVPDANLELLFDRDCEARRDLEHKRWIYQDQPEVVRYD